VTIAVGAPDRRRRDLDNVAGKAVLDLLQAHQVITDDSMVRELSSRWSSTVPAGRLHVAIAPADPDPFKVRSEELSGKLRCVPSPKEQRTMGDTYDSAAEAEADRAQQLALLAALNATERALRRDECGAWRINGRNDGAG
jgi:hypothetical protein